MEKSRVTRDDFLEDPQVKLKVLNGPNAGREVQLPMGRFLVGRAAHCHLRPTSASVSREHCVFLRSERGVTISELNSGNGSFVNGRRISGKCPLRPGDQIAFGQLRFEMVFDITSPVSASSSLETVASCPEVTDIPSSDVAGWLDEANELDRQERMVQGDMRIFRLDEPAKVATDQPGSPRPVARATAGKLPRLPLESFPDAVSAAQKALDRLFKRH